MTAPDAGLRVVRRPYPAGGGRRAVGEVVNIERARNAVQLESELYVRPLAEGAQPVVVPDGRTFETPKYAAAAGCEVAVELHTEDLNA